MKRTFPARPTSLLCKGAWSRPSARRRFPMLSMVLLLAAAGGAMTCPEPRVAEAVELEMTVESAEAAYIEAEYDFEARFDELGLLGSTLAREAMVAGGDPDDAPVLALGASFDPETFAR